MRIALVSPSPIPPLFGGMTRLLDGLLTALQERHHTELITIAFDERTPEGVLRGYYDFYRLDLSSYDRIVSCKAPAYMAEHPNHVVYLAHRLRVFYDLYEPRGPEFEHLRGLIHFMDEWALDKRRLSQLFTIGETVSRRLIKYGNIASTAVYPPTTFVPADASGAFQPGDYFLSVGRLHPWKRIDLVIRAFRLSRARCPLKIVGEGDQDQALRELATGDGRIEFLGKVSDDDLATLYASAVATIFPPISEDLGLITFESFLSGRPIVTASDSGEPAVIVENGKTGFVATPTPAALAARLDWLWQHRAELAPMSEACRTWMRPVRWEHVVDTLLEAGDRIEAERTTRVTVSVPRKDRRRERHIRLLVTDNQIIDPPLGGGRVRILQLYRHMPEDFTTTYVGTFDYPGPVFRDQHLAPNFREILTPLTAPHFRAHDLLVRLSRGQATMDVTMPLLGRWTPRYRRLIERYLPEADVLVSAHPWMVPFLPREWGWPLVYDSQNCEAQVKGLLLTGSLVGRVLARRVEATERLAVEASGLVLACSAEDAEGFRRLYEVPPEKILVVPNGVDCQEIRPADPTERARSRHALGLAHQVLAVFVGSPYHPNLEGASFIIGELAPLFPDVQFGIIGGVGPMFRDRFPSAVIPANVTLFGFVTFEKLLEVYRAAHLALNPMKQGSGTNIKMLDYMAAGLPILTTAKGSRGLAGRAGEHWIEARLEDFAAELRALLGSLEQRLGLGARARKLASERFDWAAIAARYADQLRTLVGAARSA